MIVFAVLALVFSALALRSIRTPAVVIVALLSWSMIEQWAQATSPFFVQNRTFVNLIVGCSVLFALGCRALKPRLVPQPIPRNMILVLGLFSYALFSTLWTSSDVNVVSIWYSAAPYVLMYILVGPLLLHEPKDLLVAYRYQIVIGGVFAALVLLGTEQVGRRIVLAGTDVRANPLGLAQAAGVTLICATLMRRSFRGDILVKIVVAILCMLVIVRSGSRGQLLGVIVAVAAAYPVAYSIRNIRVFLGSVVVALMLAAALSYGLTEYWGDHWRFGGDAAIRDVGGRLARMDNLTAAWLSSAPAIVFGLGNSASYDPSIIGHYSHFVALEILCELGAIGATIYVLILSNIVIDARRSMRTIAMGDEVRSALAVTVGIIVYVLLISVKQGSLLSVSIAQFFMMAMVLARLTYLQGESYRSLRLSQAERAR